ncbi:hypothetical protein G7Z17_g9299 [Cylindrodendrum hubeiense]|uniref:Uncharacterized protein n=1 Tax=Cylindrodendrum hubeiense TaxID=595255 RepID=A0A9P5H5C4_9HYPO|nr:hypothetical protein G7Z17_g9299 [Cylindrodendrum hubeiense]
MVGGPGPRLRSGASPPSPSLSGLHNGCVSNVYVGGGGVDEQPAGGEPRVWVLAQATRRWSERARGNPAASSTRTATTWLMADGDGDGDCTPHSPTELGLGPGARSSRRETGGWRCSLAGGNRSPGPETTADLAVGLGALLVIQAGSKQGPWPCSEILQDARVGRLDC